MGMRDRETRQVRAKVVPSTQRETLQNEILNRIAGSRLSTRIMRKPTSDLAEQDFIHETVNHIGEYVRGQVHTQGIENFWSLLKRGSERDLRCR